MGLVALAACSADDDDGWRVRSGVSMVYEAHKVEGAGCASGVVAFCPALEIVNVADADLEGDRIAVIRVVGQSVILHFSEDKGAHWTTYFIDEGLESDLASDLLDVGIHLTGGRLFLIYSRATSSRSSTWAFREIELDTPPYVRLSVEELPVGVFRPTPYIQKRADGRLRGGLTFAAPVIQEVDLISQDVKGANIPCTGRACFVDIYASVDRGDTFDAYSQGGPVSGLDVCRLRWTENAGSSQACIPASQWFVPNYSHRIHMMMRGTEPYIAWSQDDQAYAISLGLDGKLSPVLPLGRGKIDNFSLGWLDRPRFAEYELVETLDVFNEDGRLVRLAADGPEDVHVAKTPCAGDTCGYTGGPHFTYGLLQWLLPTGEGDYYAFYTVQAANGHANQQVLYMSREKATFSPIIADGPLPGPPDPLLTPPANAWPMTPLQVACVEYASCVGGSESAKYEACLAHFSTYTYTYFYGTRAARDRLIAAHGCPAIREVWPEGFGLSSTCGATCFEKGGECTPGVTTCSNIYSTDLSLCNTCEPNVTGYLSCDASNVYNTQCPADVCTPNVGCVKAAACTTNCTSTYDECNPTTNEVTTHDCPARGGVCADASGCARTGAMEACSTTGLTCSGPFIKGCSLGQVDYTDCRTLGYAGCSMGPGGARCY